MIVQYVVGHAQPLGGFMGFGQSACRQLFPLFSLVTGITVSHRNKFYSITHGREKGGGTTPFQIAVIRVRPDHNDADSRAVLLCLYCCHETQDEEYKERQSVVI